MRILAKWAFGGSAAGSPESFPFWLFRQPHLPLGYGFSGPGLAKSLRVTTEGVLLFSHPKAGMLPVGRIRASRLICYRAAVSLWGRKELSCVRDWWERNFVFCADKLGELLSIETDRRVMYRGRYIGLVDGAELWFTPFAGVVYSERQLMLMRCQLEKFLDRKLFVSVWGKA